MPAPSEEEENLIYWRTFEAMPLGTLKQRSLVFRQLGVSNVGGPCIVKGDRHVDALGRNGDKNVEVSVEYGMGTAVSALTTTPGGDGATYWYPYIESGVGECDISYDVRVGATALTAGMNGCSLRIYVNPRQGLIKFCHDNNGLYADDAAYAAQGFQHLQSVNADNAAHKMRGEPSQNINDYWKPELIAPAAGIFFICKKTAPLQWTIYQSVAIGDRSEVKVERFLRPSKAEVVYPFRGRQNHNEIVAFVNIPPRAAAGPARATTTEDLAVKRDRPERRQTN